ncbi:glycosyltransferase family 92 protein [Gluconobacter kondonii]|uniref:glycosyltransferase family 92 protein n=1 Tax=Gluconobacter kondonii TaxID=941463 RepID=UPI001B8B3ECF|nr:glycosyltransferase family 92 protein [Gluconobacter kondonii]MBS1079047.1 glycosyltransferase family 92 protein [Gluconobacter kondonii]
MSESYKYQYSIMTCCRWEYNNISEWISYYKKLGFDHIYIYCNDDDPRDLYTNCIPFLSEENKYITFINYTEIGNQIGMIFDFLRRFKYQTEWITFLDIDEFLLLRNTDNIKYFMSDFQNSDAVYFNWSMFGTNSFEKRPEGSVLLNYFYREKELHPLTKVISKTKIYSDQWIEDNPDESIHHGISNYFNNFKCVNVIGESINDITGNDFEKFIDNQSIYLLNNSDIIRSIAVVNHYFMKSNEDFIRRWNRSLSKTFSGQNIWKEAFDTGGYKNIIKLSNVKDTYLRDFWRKETNDAFSITEGNENIVISRGKKCTQSSISEWSKGLSLEEDATLLVEGTKDRSYSNHTSLEENPWWMIDLESIKEIKEIKIYNRSDSNSGRIKNISIYFSNFGDDWRNKISICDINWGDENKLSIKIAENAIDARFIKIEVLGMNFLHFRKVEIY